MCLLKTTADLGVSVFASQYKKGACSPEHVGSHLRIYYLREQKVRGRCRQAKKLLKKNHFFQTLLSLARPAVFNELLMSLYCDPDPLSKHRNQNVLSKQHSKDFNYNALSFWSNILTLSY